jgi:hypothetical protein
VPSRRASSAVDFVDKSQAHRARRTIARDSLANIGSAVVMSTRDARSEEARRRAQEKFAKVQQRDAETLKEKQQAFAAIAAKSARLRALRLAKERADKEAAERGAAGRTGSGARRAARKV